MEQKSGFWGYIVQGIILAVIYFAFSVVMKAVTSIFGFFFGWMIPNKKTDADVYLASAPLDAESVVNYSVAYEKLLSSDLYEFYSQEDRSGIIETYRALLSGAKADPGLEHVPSPERGGKPNLDYKVYFKAQLPHLEGEEKAFAESELRRLALTEQEESERSAVVEMFMEQFGLESELAEAAITQERMDTFSKEDWDEYCSLVKEASDSSVPTAVLVAVMNNKIEAFDGDELKTATFLYLNEIPLEYFQEVMSGDLTSTQVKQMASLYHKGASWDIAYTTVKSGV
jgi:hypothetical protein